MELEELRAEIARLSTALEEASAANIKAGEYGLQILDEKQQLEVKLVQLQAQYDAAKAEVDATKKVISHYFIVSILFRRDYDLKYR
uniref:HOOK domain-containing protein n=1 Tax=Ascaris lumbricoides TaxID=6252 RepID=A0A0M3HLZ4_ASCLU